MTREIMYRDALREAIDEEMERDRTVFIIGEGIAERGGSYKVTEGLLAKYGPKRVRDTPIAEAGMIGVGGVAHPVTASAIATLIVPIRPLIGRPRTPARALACAPRRRAAATGETTRRACRRGARQPRSVPLAPARIPGRWQGRGPIP